MNRSDRAKQFMPFDALKGLREALNLKEYEHERCIKGDISEEKIREMTNLLINAEKGCLVEVTYFIDGHYKKISGKLKLNTEFKQIKVGEQSLFLDDIFDIKMIN